MNRRRSASADPTRADVPTRPTGITRRNILILGGSAAVGAAVEAKTGAVSSTIDWLASLFRLGSANGPERSNDPSSLLGNPGIPRFEETILNDARDISSVGVQDPRRANWEGQLVSGLLESNHSAGDIKLALSVVGTRAARDELLLRFYDLRQRGELVGFYANRPEYFGQLDAAREQWARDNGIRPDVLAMAIDAQKAARELLAAAPELFFEAGPEDKRSGNNLEDSLPNPGLIAQLMMKETSGYRFIGGANAWDELNTSPAYFPTGHRDLEVLSASIYSDTGQQIPYDPRFIVGSEQGTGFSGGAIGPQFMPGNARLFMEWYDTANERLDNPLPRANVFDPFVGTTMACLYIASQFYHRQRGVEGNPDTSVVRPGYTKLDPEQRMAALYKWNPVDEEMIPVLRTGLDYYDTFEAPSQ